MTDLETIKSIFEKRGIKFYTDTTQVETVQPLVEVGPMKFTQAPPTMHVRTTISLEAMPDNDKGKVLGYSGFVSELIFKENGDLERVCIYE